MASSSRVETPTQLIELMRDQGIHLPVEISVEQMANIRFVTVTRRLHQIPFEIVKIDGSWFIDRVTREDLRPHLKRGDRLLVVQKTLLSDRIGEKEILQLIRFSKLPLIFWVTWDPGFISLAIRVSLFLLSRTRSILEILDLRSTSR